MNSSKSERVFKNFKALLKYPSIINQLKKNVEIFFFFPFWHVGGAERVHIDVLEVFKDYETLCFITNKSKDDKFKKEFLKQSKVIELGRWTEKKAFKKSIILKIAQHINKKNNVVIFGCNSPFFYDLIPYLSNKVKIIDLIHAFSDNEEGVEYYSLPYTERIDKRIILGAHTRANLISLYNQNKINTDCLKRIEIIKNKVATIEEDFVKDNVDPSLRILFVGRNSKEKRVEIFLDIAKYFSLQDVSLKFIMIGDFEDLKSGITSNVELVGEIKNKNILNKYYKEAHLILITSYREGFPMVILEAMAYGTVPISTDVGEISQYISDDRKNGFLVENYENNNLIVESFVKKIKELNTDRRLLQTYSQNAMRVSEDFSSSKFEKQYKAAFFE